MCEWIKTLDLRYRKSRIAVCGREYTVQQREYRGRKVAHEYPEPDGVFEISGRGIVRTFGDQTQPKMGDLVLIDGECFEVYGIETHASMGREKSRKFGLLTKPATPDYAERWVDIPDTEEDSR